jgi:nicotinamidase-related amidase
VQQGFDNPKWGHRNNPHAEENIFSLLQVWRKHNRPIIHVQHCSTDADSPLRPELPGNEFKELVKPLNGEKIVQKNVHSAFIGTDLEEHLAEKGITTLVIVGLTTNHCVSTTTRMAGNLGFNVFLVSDATATFDRKGPDGTIHRAENIHTISLANLHEEFATVVTTKDLLGKESL